MNEALANPNQIPSISPVPAGEDLFRVQRSLGVSFIDFKVVLSDNNLFVIENRFHQKGGPARHLHYEQDEWFYVVEGDFAIEIGENLFTLHTGDSILAPRNLPHVWACMRETGGKILIAFSPAGKMETFFREVTKANAMAPQKPELWREHGMELLGPPLSLA